MLRKANNIHIAISDAGALGSNWLFSPAVAAVLVLLAAGSLLLTTRRPGAAIHFLLISIVPSLGADLINLLVHRPWPDIASLPRILVLRPVGLSFSSGHTSFAACVLCGVIIVTAGHGWRPFLMGTAVVVMFATAASRVYSGVHYPSDVAASIVYLVAAAALVNAAWRLSLSHWSERRSGLLAGPAYGGTADAP